MTLTLPRPPAFVPTLPATPAPAPASEPFSQEESIVRNAIKGTQNGPALLRSLTDPRDVYTALLGCAIGCGLPIGAHTTNAMVTLAEKTAHANATARPWRMPLTWTDEGLVTADVHAALTALMPTLTDQIGLTDLDDAARLMLATQACALALGAPISAHTHLMVTSLVHAMTMQTPLGPALVRLLGRSVMPPVLTDQAAQVLRTPAPTAAAAPAPVVADEYTAGMLPSGFGVNAELIAALSDVTIPSGYSFDDL